MFYEDWRKSNFVFRIKKNNTILSGWVIDQENEVKQNKDFYKSPIPFYIKNGFTISTDIRIENEKISDVKIKWKH